jgi:hypothetical protein
MCRVCEAVLTKITEDEQESTDFDWFCVDDAGEIGHFTTAGFKRLPRNVERSAEDRDVLEEFFERQLKGGRGYQLDADLSKEIPTLKSGLERYLRDFVAMAGRGLYSFDIETYLSPEATIFALPCRFGRPILKIYPSPSRRFWAGLNSRGGCSRIRQGSFMKTPWRFELIH